MLTITSCMPIREPGFSRSECLELARRIDNEEVLAIGYEPMIGVTDCLDALPQREKYLVIAALRAYANV